jgi:hypothetical protein
MSNWAKQLSHRSVRMIATLTLLDLAVMPIADRYYPSRAHSLANTGLGKTLIFWAIAASLLLPLYVGIEVWWMRKSEAASKNRDLWVDAVLAFACFFLFCCFVLYSWTHYATL